MDIENGGGNDKYGKDMTAGKRFPGCIFFYGRRKAELLIRSWGVKDPAEERDCGKGDGGDEKRPQEKVLPSRKSSSRNAGYSTKIKPVKVWLSRHTSRMRRGCPRKMPVIVS